MFSQNNDFYSLKEYLAIEKATKPTVFFNCGRGQKIVPKNNLFKSKKSKIFAKAVKPNHHV